MLTILESRKFKKIIKANLIGSISLTVVVLIFNDLFTFPEPLGPQRTKGRRRDLIDILNFLFLKLRSTQLTLKTQVTMLPYGWILDSLRLLQCHLQH